jgi:hypothetical protein
MDTISRDGGGGVHRSRLIRRPVRDRNSWRCIAESRNPRRTVQIDPLKRKLLAEEFFNAALRALISLPDAPQCMRIDLPASSPRQAASRSLIERAWILSLSLSLSFMRRERKANAERRSRGTVVSRLVGISCSSELVCHELTNNAPHPRGWQVKRRARSAGRQARPA